MNESLPPTCGGPDVLGWDWAAVAAGSAESVNGTTWGAFELVGTFTDESFTPTEPAAVPGAGDDQGDGPTAEDDRFATPCPEPAGGWAPVDPTRATEQAAEEAQQVATATPGFASLWIDQQIPDAEITEENGNDPQRYVLNVSTTEDTAALETALRRVWGGSLCVSSAPRTEADLQEIQAALPEVPGLPEWFTSSSDPIDGVVDVSVAHGTQEQQRALDERFGAGAVRLSSQLEPID